MDKKLYWISVIFIVVGILISVYMTIYKLTSNDAMCLGSGDCSAVNASKYSSIYNIPVAAIGLLGYLAMLATHLLEPRQKFFEENGPLMLFGLSLTGFAFSAYLTYLEFFVIKAICPFCIASQIAILIIFVVAIIRLVRQLAE